MPEFAFTEVQQSIRQGEKNSCYYELKSPPARVTLLDGRTSPAEASPYARHIPALDGIRALAVLGVMFSHLFPGTARGAATDTLQALFRFGATGVDLFFILSGFLITGILYDSLHDPAYFRKFYARRALRIFPLYYGVLAIFLLQKLFFSYDFHHQLLSLALYLQNTPLLAAPIYAYAGPAKLPLSHFWSLSIEEQFYLVWPLLVFLIRDRKRLLWVCFAAIALCPALRAFLVLHGVPYFAIHTNTAYRCDSLLAGAALALLLRGPAHDKVLKHAGKLLLASIVPVVLVCFVPLLLSQAAYAARMQNTERIFSYSLLLLLYTSLLAVSFSMPTLKTIFSHPVPRWIGKYSYGIYVYHVILFAYLQEPLRGWIERHITANKGVGVVLCGLTVLIVSLTTAYLSYQLYERRFLHLKRYFDYRKHPDTVTTLVKS